MSVSNARARNLADNLRFLCQSQSSIADVCRRIGISRQQFNKYLTGQHYPSPHNLGLLASFFLVDPVNLASPAALFQRTASNSMLMTLRSLGQLPRFAGFSEVVRGGKDRAGSLEGIYERYQYSAIYEGQILRSVCKIQQHNGILCHGYVERFPDPDLPGQVATTFQYRGFTLMLEERLVLIDLESVQKNEITATILAPRRRTLTPLYFGLTMGVAANIAREPFATRVAMRKVGEGPLSLGHMRRAQTFYPGDPQLPADIVRYLDGDKRILRASDMPVVSGRETIG